MKRSLILLTIAMFATGADAAPPQVTSAEYDHATTVLRVAGTKDTGLDPLSVHIQFESGWEFTFIVHEEFPGAEFAFEGLFPPEPATTPVIVSALSDASGPGPAAEVVQTNDPDPPPTACPEQDWSFGAPISHDCLSEPEKSIFEAHEFRLGVPLMVRPDMWCRWDRDADNAVYWPASAGDCGLGNDQQEIASAIDGARASALSHGASPDWMHPETAVIVAEFTSDGLQQTGGALSSAGQAGHILLSTQKLELVAPAGYCTLVHEFQHSNIQYMIFPSMTADLWGIGIWPEALAFLGMKDDPVCADYWTAAHTPWNDHWVTGYFGGGNKQKRQIGLFFEYLRAERGVNWYEWMLDQHGALLAGDEMTALKAEVPQLNLMFSQFVAGYNMRTLSESSDLQLPLNIGHVPFSPHDDIRFDLSGMKEGDSELVFMDGADYRICITLVRKCSSQPLRIGIILSTDISEEYVESVGFYTDGVVYAEPEYQYCVNESGNEALPPGAYVVTMASLEGTAFANRIHINPWSFYDPGSPWPPSAEALDPWAEQRNCQ